jgi:hypothetical protein
MRREKKFSNGTKKPKDSREAVRFVLLKGKPLDFLLMGYSCPREGIWCFALLYQQAPLT